VRCSAIDTHAHSHALSTTDTKTYDVQGLQLGVSALYNYGTHTPYAGFILESTSGVSSAAKSNSFSINQAFLLEDLPVETKIEMQVRHSARRGGVPVRLSCGACHPGRGQASGHQVRPGVQHGWPHRPGGYQVPQLDCDVHGLKQRSCSGSRQRHWTAVACCSRHLNYTFRYVMHSRHRGLHGSLRAAFLGWERSEAHAHTDDESTSVCT